MMMMMMIIIIMIIVIVQCHSFVTLQESQPQQPTK